MKWPECAYAVHCSIYIIPYAGCASSSSNLSRFNWSGSNFGTYKKTQASSINNLLAYKKGGANGSFHVLIIECIYWMMLLSVMLASMLLYMATIKKSIIDVNGYWLLLPGIHFYC